MARPSSFSQEVADTLCEMIAEGASLRKACSAEGAPSIRTVLNWQGRYPEFAVQMAAANEAREQHLFDEMQEIANDSSRDYVDKVDSKGETYRAFDHEHVSRAKLRIETLRWRLSKMSPKKYGDRLETNATVDTTAKIQISWAGETPRFQRAKTLADLVASYGCQLVSADAVLLSGPRSLPPTEFSALTRRLAEEGFLERPDDTAEF